MSANETDPARGRLDLRQGSQALALLILAT
jgi:hypothetical protein